jgi:hypothetical protein
MELPKQITDKIAERDPIGGIRYVLEEGAQIAHAHYDKEIQSLKEEIEGLKGERKRIAGLLKNEWVKANRTEIIVKDYMQFDDREACIEALFTAYCKTNNITP